MSVIILAESVEDERKKLFEQFDEAEFQLNELINDIDAYKNLNNNVHNGNYNEETIDELIARLHYILEVSLSQATSELKEIIKNL